LPGKLYEYKAAAGICKSRELQEKKDTSGAFKLKTVKRIAANPGSLKEALNDGPVIASVKAGNLIFKNYANGVIDSKDCTSKFKNNSYDHSVLVVGYGNAMKGGQYFLVKNSFGTSWGSLGYARISAHTIDDPQGTCGILGNLYQPVAKKPVNLNVSTETV
jgi:hypothetical protein